MSVSVPQSNLQASHLVEIIQQTPLLLLKMEVVRFDFLKLKDQSLAVLSSSGCLCPGCQSRFGRCVCFKANFVDLFRDCIKVGSQFFFAEFETAFVSDPVFVDLFDLIFKRLNLRVDDVELSGVQFGGVPISLGNGGRVRHAGLERLTFAVRHGPEAGGGILLEGVVRQLFGLFLPVGAGVRRSDCRTHQRDAGECDDDDEDFCEASQHERVCATSWKIAETASMT